MLSVTVDLLHVDRRTSPLILFPHKCVFTEIDHVSLHKATEIFFSCVCVFNKYYLQVFGSRDGSEYKPDLQFIHGSVNASVFLVSVTF